MNWLVFTGKKNKRQIERLAAFFESKQVRCTFIKADTTKFLCAYENPPALTDLYTEITNATHCICFGTENIPLSPLFMYAAGLFAGKKIPVFLLSGQGHIPSCIADGLGTVFSDLSSLLEALERDFPAYVKAEVRQQVCRKLFESGIPFTPDAFSNYIARGDMETSALFLKAGMDINSRDSAGTPMLCIAVRCNKPALVQWLVEQGADLNTVSEDRGYTALMDAVWKNNYEAAEILIKAGAEVNTVAKDGQPLMVLAAGISDIKMCRLLFENGGDVFFKDRMGLGALDYAKVFKKQILIDLFSSGTV